MTPLKIMGAIPKPQSELEVEQIIQTCNQSANSQKYSEQHGIAESGVDVFQKLTLSNTRTLAGIVQKMQGS